MWQLDVLPVRLAVEASLVLAHVVPMGKGTQRVVHQAAWLWPTSITEMQEVKGAKCTETALQQCMHAASQPGWPA